VARASESAPSAGITELPQQFLEEMLLCTYPSGPMQTWVATLNPHLGTGAAALLLQAVATLIISVAVWWFPAVDTIIIGAAAWWVPAVAATLNHEDRASHHRPSHTCLQLVVLGPPPSPRIHTQLRAAALQDNGRTRLATGPQQQPEEYRFTNPGYTVLLNQRNTVILSQSKTVLLIQGIPFY